MKKLTKNKKIILIALIIALLSIVSVVIVNFFLVKSEFGKCSIKKALAELENYEFGEYDNLTFDCKPLIPDTDEFYQYTSDFSENYGGGTKEYNKILEMANNLLGVTEYSSDAVIHTKDNMVAVYDYSQNFTASYYVTGTFSFTIHDIYEKIFPREVEEYYHDRGKQISYYNVNNTGIPDEYFNTYDGKKASVKKVVENSDKFIEENIKQYLSGVMNEELVLETVTIKENLEGIQFCILSYTYKYNDFLLNSYGYISDVDSIRCPVFTIVYANESEYFTFHNSRYDGNIISKGEKVKGNVYPLSSAEKIVSNELAPFKKYKVTEVSLRNVCIEETGVDEFNYRPMWVFVLEDRGMKFFSDRQVVVAFVDFKTGDFYAYDSIERMSLSGLNDTE